MADYDYTAQELHKLASQRDVLLQSKAPKDLETWMGFARSNTIPDYFGKIMRNSGLTLQPKEQVIGVLGEKEYSAEGIIFTNLAMYVDIPRNTHKTFAVSYDDITRLVYNMRQDSLMITVGSASWTLDVPYWNKRVIGDFLELACNPRNVNEMRRRPNAKWVVMEVEYGYEGDPAEQRKQALAALLFDIDQCSPFCPQDDEEDGKDKIRRVQIAGPLVFPLEYLLDRDNWQAPKTRLDHRRVGFSHNGTLSPDFLAEVQKWDLHPSAVESVLCTLEEDGDAGDGIVFTDQALYANCTSNSDRVFAVRYSDINGLEAGLFLLPGNIGIGTADDTHQIDTDQWNKRAIREFLTFVQHLR